MTVQTIESKDLSVGDLFSSFYLVPDYQREYVWEDKQVEQLLQDIYTEFSALGPGVVSEYFIGSIVVCTREDGVLELIDGQQRVTTLFIILCALRDYLNNIAPGESIESLKSQIASYDVDDQGRDVFRFRVDLQYEDSCGVLQAIGKGEMPKVDKSNQTRSVTNILNAYHSVQTFLRNQFKDDADGVRKFYAYLNKKVKLIRVKTVSVAHALKIFETINDRGVGLDSMDLLKNLMFMHARPEEFEILKKQWKKLVDALFTVQENPLRFLRYFIVSEFGVDRLRMDEIYEWFVRNEALCGYKKEPLKFTDWLNDAVTAYTNFLRGKDARGRPNRYLENMRYLSGSARQHLILLLAGRHLPEDCFNELCREVENLFFAYIVTRENTREFERNFAKWAPRLRKVQDRKQLDEFVKVNMLPEKKKLVTRFELAFREMTEKSLQKYRIRYVLAKLTQYVNEQALGSQGASVDLRNFIHSKVEIEHILPQQPDEEVLKAFDKPDTIDDYVHRLGNLTLLEKSINSSISNGLFEKKRVEYYKSGFLLTKSLGGDISVGKNTAFSRIAQHLESFESWNSKSIERRQAMLTRLAAKTWDMPMNSAAQG